jgi:ribonuclease-3
MMNMKPINKIFILAGVLAAMSLTSCEDGLTSKSPSAFDEPNVFAQYELAEYNIFSIYEVFGHTNCHRGRYLPWYGFNTDIEIYLDSGEKGREKVRTFVIPFIEKELSENYSSAMIDPKTELQQFIQQAEGDFLEYVIVDESGPDHNKVFVSEARLNSNMIGRGKGRSKREAEQNAAMEALRLFAQIKDEQEKTGSSQRPQNHKEIKKTRAN